MSYDGSLKFYKFCDILFVFHDSPTKSHTGVQVSDLVLMIVDSADDFRLALEREFADDFTVHSYHSGQEALQSAAEIAPDAMVLDLFLTGIDGITLLREIRSLELHPKVLVLTRLSTAYISDVIDGLGIEYVMLKPCLPSAVAGHIRDMCREAEKEEQTVRSLRAQIKELLNELGISARYKGYEYLSEAIFLYVVNPPAYITKEIYPMVAKKYNCAITQVERTIRTAINYAWKNTDVDVWTKHFASAPNKTVKKPSNGFFISELAKYLRRKSSSC